MAFKGPGPVRARFDGRRAIFCTRSKQRVSAAPLHVRGIPVVDLLIAESAPLNEARPSPPKARQGRSAPRPSPRAHPRSPGESRPALIGHAAPPARASAAALCARRPRRGALGPLARPPEVCDVPTSSAELVRRAGRLAAHRDASPLAPARDPVVGKARIRRRDASLGRAASQPRAGAAPVRPALATAAGRGTPRRVLAHCAAAARARALMITPHGSGISTIQEP